MKHYNDNFSWAGTVTAIDNVKKIAIITLSSPAEAVNDTLSIHTVFQTVDLSLNASVSGSYVHETNKVVLF
jgi:hypothetical protein